MEQELPHPGDIIGEARRRRKWSLEHLAQLAGTTAATVSRIESKDSRGRPDTIARLATALGLDVRVMNLPVDDALGVRDDDADHEGPSRQLAEARSGLVRSFPMDSGVYADGRVVGPITYDAIKDPTGKGGKVLSLGHSRRGKPAAVESREVPGVPPKCKVAFVRERIDVRNGDQVVDMITPGSALIVSIDALAQPGDLILVAKNIDWTADVDGGSEDGLAGVQLMRYVEADAGGERLLYGWPLDGSKAKRVQLDGPYSIAGVVIGRWSGRA